MRIAVVTPYFREPLEVLQRCAESVRTQTHGEVVHVMVADGHARDEVDGWGVTHIRLPHAHGDYGDTPRTMGALSAAARGVDAIAFLDADNWFEPAHLERLIRRQAETNAQVVTATRNVVRTDGSFLSVCKASDGRSFSDMNCYLILREAFGAISAWAFKDPRAAIVGDKVLWSIIQGSGARLAHCATPTVNYVTLWAINYLEAGETPPPGAKVMLPVEGEPYPKMFDYLEAKAAYDAGGRPS